MVEGKSAQVDLEKGLHQMSNDNDSSSPENMQKIKADMEDSEGKIDSPTPEKPDSGRNESVVSSLTTNLVAERYKDRLAEELLGNEDETDDEDDNENIVSSGIQSLVSNELLEKHKNLLNLFNRMDSSIRLLRLRKKLTTFKNIATQVEVLAKRKFLYTHLAQMKHLFPEAIQINRVLLHDEKSTCMYADMEITLAMDSVECNNPHESPAMAICEAFRSKLLCFLESPHKVIDIPKATLPEPFNREELYLDTLHNGRSVQRVLVNSRGELYLDKLHDGHSVERVLESSSENGFSNASHFPRSFQKLMSQKSIAKDTEKTKLLPDPEVTSLGVDATGAPDGSSAKHVSVPVKTNICDTPNRRLISFCENSTPKQAISPSPVMTETPQMQTPKRPLPTPLGKVETSSRQGSEPRSASSARRSLIMFSPSKLDESPSANTTKLDKDRVANITEDEVTTEKCLFPEETCTFTNLLVENDEDKTNQVPSMISQEKLYSLRATFDIVCSISRSANNSLIITKQELFHNILANNLEIEETGEIEEQLHILEDLSPDWISKKLRGGGEVLYSIKQIPDEKLVRERLVEVI
uniref:Uncharacterized protein n=1 Tax=Avena sativa TaxID=4498 RepID=A0ACD5TNN8_AVESA